MNQNWKCIKPRVIIQYLGIPFGRFLLQINGGVSWANLKRSFFLLEFLHSDFVVVSPSSWCSSYSRSISWCSKSIPKDANTTFLIDGARRSTSGIGRQVVVMEGLVRRVSMTVSVVGCLFKSMIESN